MIINSCHSEQESLHIDTSAKSGTQATEAAPACRNQIRPRTVTIVVKEIWIDGCSGEDSRSEIDRKLPHETTRGQLSVQGAINLRYSQELGDIGEMRAIPSSDASIIHLAVAEINKIFVKIAYNLQIKTAPARSSTGAARTNRRLTRAGCSDMDDGCWKTRSCCRHPS